jgi:hypothetical protein
MGTLYFTVMHITIRSSKSRFPFTINTAVNILWKTNLSMNTENGVVMYISRNKEIRYMAFIQKKTDKYSWEETYRY